jgi:uncharacterized protein YwqG
MAHCPPEELRTTFAAAGYAELAEDLIRESRPAVAILRKPADDDDIPSGASKLGGWPDLPEGFRWPEKDGTPLAFLGQFALSAVPRFDAGEGLPAGGLLSVFYDNVGQPWGFDPKDKGGAHIFFWFDEKELVRTEPPKGAYSDDPEYDEPFKPCTVRYEAVTTYPELGGEIYEREDFEAICDLYSETVQAGQGEEDEPRHQFFGLPLLIQNPMEEECQLASNGIYLGDENISSKDRKRAETLREGAKDWMLLLQIDSDDSAGWMWGDVGILYFWIRRQDFAAGDFSKAWCVLQCT